MSNHAKTNKKEINEFEKIINNNNKNVDDMVIKRLLQKKQLSPLQVGRIIFLDSCKMFSGQKQIFTSDEYLQMISKINPKDDEIGEFITFQRLTTYAINAQNYLKVRNESSLIGLQYLKMQMDLIKKNPKSKLIDPDQILFIIGNIKSTLSFIESYAIFYDAMRLILKNDRRLKPSYRITGQAPEVLKAVKEYNKFIVKEFSNAMREKYNLYTIDNIPKIDSTEQTKVKKLGKYLMDKYSYTNFVDNVVTNETTLYIASYFADI